MELAGEQENRCGYARRLRFVEEALAGPLVGHTLARSGRFIGWSARVTDRLPLALASGWYFALRRAGAEASNGARL